MKQETLLASVALSALLVSNVHATKLPYELTGDQFVQLMAHAEPLNESAYRDREKAYSYLDGVKDALLGTGWCPARPRKTFELAYDAADYIRALPIETQKKNAARLLQLFPGFPSPLPKRR